jgi:thioredoxin 1
MAIESLEAAAMGSDEELERIRQKKLREMMRREESELDLPVLDSPMEVTDSNFNEVIQKNSLVVIDCWAAWCAPCRMIGPIIEELAKDYAGKVVFGKLNVDQNRNVPLKYQIMSIPTILVFKNGELVDRVIGAMPRRILEPKITQHI